MLLLDAESDLAESSHPRSESSSREFKYHNFGYVGALSDWALTGTDHRKLGIMCYFIYWVIQFPFMLVPPQKIQWLFLAKAIIVPPSWLALLIWAFVKVPPSDGFFTLHATATGSSFSWAYLTALNVSLGFYATLAVNIPDFTVGVLKSSWDL